MSDLEHQKRPTLVSALGPGLLFAGAAIGVSHLVQSTRAGALFGLGLIPVVLLANLMKYPALAAGPRYTLATGRTLIDAYRDQGRHAVWFFAVITFGTMFAVHGAISMVTGAVLDAGLSMAGVPIGLTWSVIAVNIAATLLLATGGFTLLDLAIKALMAVLALATFVVTAIELPGLDFSTLTMSAEAWAAPATIGFAVVLAGWMPAPLDIAAWNSLWCVAAHRKNGTPTKSHAMFDFHLGMTACVLLALCFVVLGTARMNAEGVEPAEDGVGFARQVIELYTGALGAWAGPVVALGAIAVMGSTLLTVADALPRTGLAVVRSMRGLPACAERDTDETRSIGYWAFFALMQVGGLSLALWIGRLTQMVDLATMLSFLATPVLAFFNLRAMRSKAVPTDARFGKGLHLFGVVCVVFWLGFAGLYLWTRFGS